MSAKVEKGLLLLAVLLLCLVGVCAAEDASIDPMAENGYEAVARSERWTLYLRRDIMAVILESNATGQRLYSAVQNPDEMRDNATWKGFYQSGVIMEYIDEANPTLIQADFLNTPHTLRYSFFDGGFTADVSFPDIGIGYEMTVTLDDEGLHVVVPRAKFREEMSEKYKIGTFCVFPFLGHSYLGQDEGYMIIPDGQGALVTLQDNQGAFSSPYNVPAYGDNIGTDTGVFFQWYMEPEQVLMPVYGMVRTEEQIAFLGVIEEGDCAARIKAYPNGVVTKFDWICAQFVYRLVYSQPTINDAQQSGSASSINMTTPRGRAYDIKLHFLLAEENDASYAGLALRYREYLTAKGVFGKEDSEQAFSMRLDFVGVETENDIFGKRSFSMTTFEQAEEILRDLTENGVTELVAACRGWQKGGLTGGLPVTAYAPDRLLGDKEGMEALLAAGEDMNVTVMAEADFLRLNLDTHTGLTYSAFKKINGDNYRQPTYKKVFEYLYYLTPSRSLEYAKSTAGQMADAGFKAISLTGVTSLVTDYMENKTYLDGGDMMRVYAEICQGASEAMALHLANANAYLWPYASALYDMPIADSEYLFAAESIPFMAITLSGKLPYYAEYINFQANSTKFKLQLIEQGALPAFLLTWEDTILLIDTNSNNLYSAQYALYREMILQWYLELASVYAKISGTHIQNHEKTGDITTVTWSNGTKIYINWSDEPGALHGVQLQGLSYAVVTEHEE